MFANFNGAVKIDQNTFAMWMRIMQRVPKSVLWLLSMPEAAIPRLRRNAEKFEIAADRLIFAPRIEKEKHMTRMQSAHLLLDTLVYNAHTSAGDALWAGLPILTIAGSTMPARVCSSMLRAAGLDELVMPNMSAFEDRAVHLAFHPDELAALKQRAQAARDSPLFDTTRYVDDFAAGVSEAWRRHSARLEPAHIDVALLRVQAHDEL